jgi:nicotinate-nucleotide adenylyltransferase
MTRGGFPGARRLGLLGGTFDPPHVGHLVLAEQCRHALHLDQVLVVVTGRPPHKGSLSSFHHRLEMARRAFEDNPLFRVDSMEGEREGASYTIDTLRLLRDRHGDTVLFWLLMGSDSLQEFETWRSPEEIVKLCRIGVYARPGFEAMGSEWSAHVDPVEGPTLDISSTQLRQWACRGRSLRYLVPEAVERYVRAGGLYTTEETDGGPAAPKRED